MSFEATKREWGELHSFLRILADGSIAVGTPDGMACEERRYKVAVIQREEHDGTRRYLVDGENIRISGE